MWKMIFYTIQFILFVFCFIVALFTSMLFLDLFDNPINLYTILKILGSIILFFASSYIGGYLLVKADEEDSLGDVSLMYFIFSSLFVGIYHLVNRIVGKNKKEDLDNS